MIEPSSITERCGSRRVRIFSEDFVELTKLTMACGGSSLIGYGSGTSVQIFDWLPLQKFQKETTLIQLNYLHGTPKKVYRNQHRIPAGDGVIESAQRGLDYGQVMLTDELIHVRAKENPRYVYLDLSNDRKIHQKNKGAKTGASAGIKATVQVQSS